VTAPGTSPGSERTEAGAASDQGAADARPADRALLDHGVRTGDLPGKAADSKFAPSLAPLASMSSSAQTSTGQEKSAQSFAEHQGPRGDIQTPSAPAADGAVATTAFRAEHGPSLAIGQAIEIVNVSSAGKTAVGVMLPDGNGGPTIPDDGDLRRQIVQGIRLQWRDGAGDARLTLRPEYLGEVTIALRVEHGSVTAHLSADAAEVRAWMGANELLLRQALADRGLALDRLTVSDEPAKPRPDGDRRQRQPQQEGEQRPRPQRVAGTFEIVV
jgi:flagellar hook-length control protein FliK